MVRFGEQLKLLKALCDGYDEGQEILALSIATSIRVLVHDTASSTSLLNHLQKKSGKFLSTNYRTKNASVHLGLIRRVNVGVHGGSGGQAKYWPLCDERYFPSPKDSCFMSFDDWWTEQVFRSSKALLTRKDLVLSVANKDGGAHVDHEVEVKYDDFRKSWSGGSTLVGTKSGIHRGYDNIPTYPAIRQIAYELQLSVSIA